MKKIADARRPRTRPAQPGRTRLAGGPRRALLPIAFAALLVGCRHLPAAPPAGRGVAAVPELYGLRPGAPGWDLRTAPHAQGDGFRVERFDCWCFDDVLGRYRQITGHIYLPLGGHSPYPLIELSPILAAAATGFLEMRYFGAHMARRGMASFFVYQDQVLLDASLDGLELERRLRSMTRSTIQALDLLLEHYPLDADRVASFGISFGGIRNVLLGAVEPRVRLHVFGLAGADLVDILARSRERQVRRYLAGRSRRTGESPSAILADLELHLQSQPELAARALDPLRVLLFLARWDGAVVPSEGRRLHEALGRPALWLLPAGHYNAVLAYPWAIEVCHEFLLQGF